MNLLPDLPLAPFNVKQEMGEEFDLPTDCLEVDNPWNVVSMFHFAYFCCPECEARTQSKQEFVNHASIDHPWVNLIIQM